VKYIRFSELLGRKVIETDGGRIVNKFSIKSRRNVLFFADILANYVKRCEDAGFAEEIGSIGYDWTLLSVQELMPKTISIMPASLKMGILRNIWINIGALTDLKFSHDGDAITLVTKNEMVREIIGNNHYSTESFRGIIAGLFKKETETVSVEWTDPVCTYRFRLLGAPAGRIDSKSKDAYNRMNYRYSLGSYSMENAIKDELFKIKGNRLHFRESPMFMTESTLYHIISSRGPELGSIPTIAKKYFDTHIQHTSTIGKLLMIKNLLHVSGWGMVNVITDENKITFSINNPPYGLQKPADSWSFLIATILGYLWTIDENYVQTDQSFASDTIKTVFEI